MEEADGIVAVASILDWRKAIQRRRDTLTEYIQVYPAVLRWRLLKIHPASVEGREK